MATTRSSSQEHDREEKGDLSSASPSTHSSPFDHQAVVDDNGVVILEKSRGVVQMETLTERLNTKYRIALYGGFALLAYVMSLEQYTNSTYLSTATSVSFAAHSTLATIRSIKSVFQAVSQPPIAAIANSLGRVEAYCLCILLYAVGQAVAASAQNIYAYAVGNAIYVLGVTGLFLLQNIIISDISSTRNRLFWSIFPSIPGVINVWVSGNITQSLLGAKQETANNWRWGLGMFCILTPALAIPIMLSLGYGMRPRKKDPNAPVLVPPPRAAGKTLGAKFMSVFWQLDFVGLLLFVAGAGMILVTITIANGKGSKWSDAHCIALLVVGGVCSIAFILWERFFARHPLIPFALLSNRTVIVCFIIALVHPTAGGIVGGYLYTFLVVAGNQSTVSATRIGSIASFSGTLCAALAGVIVRYTRYLKPIIIFGFCVEVLALGLMIRYRGSTNSQGDLAMVQVVRGIGSGFIGFPTQAAIQTVTKHEHLAAITAAYLTVYYLAGGIGSAIGGGVWTNTVPTKIRTYMGNDTLAAAAYANPIGFIATYGVGTPERLAVARAQDEAQRIMTITGTCIAVIGLISVFFLQSVRLTDEQTLAEVEERDDEVTKLKAKTAAGTVAQ
ncbi:major facilitator superfamily domain-containing protein [Leucosporidium creatinivorum]|uniref:Major facilitator superfamily domain-containing protein n=1 Tax=Leucosporidium creatinivorum TaxID=106004 RepID=A0A1Y2G3K0_9BASI|nr:major facilitator superfamily domain-containing protein [Leucosporidium creatinivorum]